MKFIRKSSLVFVFAALVMATFAASAFCDSFVDKDALKLQTDSGTALSATSNCPADKATSSSINGDSFVNETAVQSLKDFRFSRPFHHSPTADSDQSDTTPLMNTNDSFVSVDTL